MVGKEYINADKYLQDIVRDKRYWENKRQNIHLREKEMEKTIARYETEIAELQRSRKEILRKAKEDAEQLLRESNATYARNWMNSKRPWTTSKSNTKRTR